MESVKFYDIRSEKANAIFKYRQLRKIANLFRFIELCLILVVISKFSIHLPTAFKNSGEYFRCFSMTLISPRFVFLIGNAIVIILFAKSGQFDPTKKNSVPDLYEEFIKKSEKNQKSRRAEIERRIKQTDSNAVNQIDPSKNSVPDLNEEFIKNSEKNQKTRRAEIERRIKQTDNNAVNQIDPSKKNSAPDLYEEFIKNSEKNQKSLRDENDNNTASVSANQTENPEEIKHYQRSQSEKMIVVTRANPHRELRRSETQKCEELVRLSEGVGRGSYSEDRMSSEEFRRTVEAFIARQQRLRREEEFCES